MPAFHEYQPLVRPPWHAGVWGERWAQAMGVLKDGILNGAQQATTVRFLSKCPPDALRVHGSSVGVPQAPGEHDEEYRVRLKKLWHLAEWRGTNQGIVDALDFVLRPRVSPDLIIPSNWIEVKESFTAGWGRHILHADKRKRQRWVNVIIRPPHIFGDDFASRYGDGSTYGGGKLYGPNGDPRWFPLLQQIVRNMKPAHAYCEWIAIVLAGDVKNANLVTDGDPLDAASRVAYIPVI